MAILFFLQTIICADACFVKRLNGSKKIEFLRDGYLVLRQTASVGMDAACHVTLSLQSSVILI